MAWSSTDHTEKTCIHSYHTCLVNDEDIRQYGPAMWIGYIMAWYSLQPYTQRPHFFNFLPTTDPMHVATFFPASRFQSWLVWLPSTVSMSCRHCLTCYTTSLACVAAIARLAGFILSLHSIQSFWLYDNSLT